MIGRADVTIEGQAFVETPTNIYKLVSSTNTSVGFKISDSDPGVGGFKFVWSEALKPIATTDTSKTYETGYIYLDKDGKMVGAPDDYKVRITTDLNGNITSVQVIKFTPGSNFETDQELTPVKDSVIYYTTLNGETQIITDYDVELDYPASSSTSGESSVSTSIMLKEWYEAGDENDRRSVNTAGPYYIIHYDAYTQTVGSGDATYLVPAHDVHLIVDVDNNLVVLDVLYPGTENEVTVTVENSGYSLGSIYYFQTNKIVWTATASQSITVGETTVTGTKYENADEGTFFLDASGYVYALQNDTWTKIEGITRKAEDFNTVAGKETIYIDSEKQTKLYADIDDYDALVAETVSSIKTYTKADDGSFVETAYVMSLPHEDPDDSTSDRIVRIGEPDIVEVISDAVKHVQTTEKVLKNASNITFKRSGMPNKGEIDFANQRSDVIPCQDGTETALVLRFTELLPGEKPQMLFYGEISGIKLNTVTLPLTQNDVKIPETINKSYRITDTLYVSDVTFNGVKNALVIQINPAMNFSSRYDSKIYISTNVKAEELKAGEGHPVITILQGQQIMRELRTDHIATDLNGTYWYVQLDKNGDYSWDDIDPSDVHLNSDGTGYIDYTFNGNKIHYLEITLEDDENDSDNPEKVLYYRFPIFNGTAYTYVKAGSDGSLRLDPNKQNQAEVEKAITMRVFTDTKGTDFNIGLVSAANGDVTIIMTDPNGSVLDGDGKPDNTDIYAPEGTVLIISDSAGQIGEDENPLEIEAEVLDIRNFDGEEIVETETHLYVEEGDLLIKNDITVDAVVWDIKTYDGSVIFADTADAEEGIYDLTVINGGTAEIATNKVQNADKSWSDNASAESPGKVLIDELTVQGAADGTASTLIIDAEGDVATANETFTYAYAEITSRKGSFTALDLAVAGSCVAITAGEDCEVNEVTVEGAADGIVSILIVYAEGDVSTANETFTDAYAEITAHEGSFTALDLTLTGSYVAITAGEDCEVNEVTVDGAADGSVSTLIIDAGGDVSTDNETFTDAYVEIIAHEGSFTALDIAVTRSEVTVFAGSDGEVHEIRAYDSDLNMDMGGDLRFDNAIVRMTDLTLAAGKVLRMREGGGNDCSEYGQHAFIQIDEDDTAADSSITLSGEESIGESDCTLIVDIPEDITLVIPKVGDLYLESLEIIPQKENADGDPEYIRITADDLKFGVDSVTHPDNPKVNEFTGTEVESHEKIEGDYLDHIVDELRPEDLPFQTPEEIAERVIDQKGDDWLTIVNSEAVVKVIEDSKLGKDIVTLATDDQIDNVLSNLRTNDKTASSTDKELAEWVIKNTKAYPQLKGKLESGQKLTDEEILSVVNGYEPSDSKDKKAWREKKISGIITAKDKNGKTVGASELWDVMKEADTDEDRTALLAAIIEKQVEKGSKIETIYDLPGVVTGLLTEEEIKAIKQAAIDHSEIPAEAESGYNDEEPKGLTIEIGTATGNANIYNDGDINITVNGESDLTAEYIRSERGDIDINVEKGSLLSTDSSKENILGGNVVLKASEDIGASIGAVDLQQRDNKPAVVVNLADTDESEISPGTVHLDENGKWVFDVALTYDWARKDIEDATMRLDAESENGSIALNEVEGGTGIGIISAAEDVAVTTDGDLTDVRADEEKEQGKDNITSGNDTVVEAPNGAAGTSESPIEVNVGGHMTADTKDDIHVESDEDLSITADTQDGTVTVSTDGDLVLDNTANAAHGTGDITVYAEAGGNAEVTITGDIRNSSEVTAGENAAVKAGEDIIGTDIEAVENVAVEAGGDIIRAEITAGENAAVEAGGDISRTDIKASEEADVKAGEDIANTYVEAGRDTAVEAGGDIVNTDIKAGENAVVNVGGDVTNTDVEAGENAMILTGGDIINADIEAGENADVIAGGNIVNTNVDAGATAHIEAEGSVTAGSGNLIAGDDVVIIADSDGNGVGSVGTSDKPVRVDTASGNTGSGTLEVSGAEVYIKEVSGDLVIDHVAATEGDAEITAPGSITDMNAEDLLKEADQALKEASDADNIASTAEDRANVLNENAKELEDKADKAESEAEAAREEADKAEEDAKKAADEAKELKDEIQKINDEIKEIESDPDLTEEKKAEKIAELNRQKEELEMQLTDKEKEAQEAADKAKELDEIADGKEEEAADAREEADKARETADKALDEAKEKRKEADRAQAKADDLLERAKNEGASISTEGDLTIHSGGDIGSDDNSLNLAVSGSLTVGAPGDVSITNNGDLHIADLDADGNADKGRNVSITANGDLTCDAVIAGDKADINTLSGGNVGSSEKPFDLDVNEINGTIAGDATITNEGDLKVNDLTVGGKLNLTVGGDLTAGDMKEGTANITAKEAVIRADGDVGTKEKPLVTAVDTLSVTGKDISIHSITDLEINRIEGRDVMIDVDGKTTAGKSPVNIIANNLDLSSYGSIGTEEHPLVISVSGRVNITNVYGHQFTINVYSAIEELIPTTWYRKEADEEEEEVKPAPVPATKPSNNGGNGTQTEEKEWALTNFILTLANILMALLLLWLYLRKKKRGEATAADKVKLIALGPAIASLTTYVLTENMQGKMIAADKWTAMMLLYFVADMGVLYYTERYKNPSKEQ
ncbi:MAG: hypothetical protein IJB14_05560 [Firmicutes bacterium]|nr:hypothetical protein [Bacillota bacterium]